MNYFLEGLQRFSDVKGRTGKKAFWIFTLIAFALIQIIAFIEKSMGFPIMNVPFLTMVFSLAMYVPMLTIGARRMHDIGKSGWYYLIPFYNLYLALQDGEPVANHWGAPTV